MTKSISISIDHLTDEEHKQQEVMWELTNSIPLNRFGLPRFVFRLDYLPYTRFLPDIPEEELEAQGPLPQKDAREDIPPRVSTQETETEHDPRDELPEELDLSPFEGHEQEPVGEDDSERSSWFDLVPSNEAKLAGRSSDQTEVDVETGGGDGGRRELFEQQSHPEFARHQYGLYAGFTQEELANARVILRYDGGYPVFPNGKSLWSRFDWEPPEAYAAFNIFLYYAEQKHSPRILAKMPEVVMEEAGIEIPLERIQLYSDLYYWSWRAAAYDAFKEQEYRFQMEHRMRKTLDTHYGYAESLITRLMEYMNDEEEFWEMMTPKAASELFSKLISTQRVSSGLPSSGPPNEARTGGSSSTTVSVGVRSGNGGRSAAEDDRDSGIIDLGGGQSLESISGEALKDPETAHLFQELIIKLTTEERR